MKKRKKTIYSCFDSMFCFVIFILVGMILFFLMAYKTDIEVIKTFFGSCSENKIVVNEPLDTLVTKVYVYKSKEKKVLVCNDIKSEVIDNKFTVIIFDASNAGKDFDGMVKVDVIFGKTNLLNIILGIEKKYIENELQEW